VLSWFTKLGCYQNMEVMRVVCAALVDNGKVLAGLRRPPHAGWELPGGKVEAGESDEQALIREIVEELGCVVCVEQWVAEEPLAANATLRMALVQLVEGRPEPLDHASLQWVELTNLDRVAWLPVDRTLLSHLSPTGTH
jgi:8-oxo-dGTP diphosphatase